jgi:hypothetical protein
MRFEVAYPSGVKNEVELEGTVALLGRDPSCDLVLNDVKCSRKHAVIEAGPDGMVIRDNGSANGIYVNSRKVDRSPLGEGDTVRLGQIVLTVLPEEFAPTVAMTSSELDDVDAAVEADVEETEPIPRSELTRAARNAGPGSPSPPPVRSATPPPKATPPVPPPPPERPRPVPAPPPLPHRSAPPRVSSPPARSARATGPPRPPAQPQARALAGLIPRPATVSLLAGLWLLGVLLYGALGLGLARAGDWGTAATAVIALSGVVMASISGAMGFGLWTLQPWARMMQLTLAGVGLLTCVGTLPCAAILAYVLRPEVEILFSGARDYRQLAPRQAELLADAPSDVPYTIAILVALVISAVLAVLLGWGAYWYLDLGSPEPGAAALSFDSRLFAAV